MCRIRVLGIDSSSFPPDEPVQFFTYGSGELAKCVVGSGYARLPLAASMNTMVCVKQKVKLEDLMVLSSLSIF